MTRMYATVDHEGRHAIQNLADGTLLKSKESGTVIAFSDKEKANNVRDFFQSHYDDIVEASRVWLLKEVTPDGVNMMRRIRID